MAVIKIMSGSEFNLGKQPLGLSHMKAFWKGFSLVLGPYTSKIIQILAPLG